VKISCKSLYHSAIEFDGNAVRVVGPLSLLIKMNELKLSQGVDAKMWTQIDTLQTNDDVLIHEFISRLQNAPVIPYTHEELCHCRMVPADKVHQAIKQGCRDVKEIARTTLAGTGCGTCRKDTEDILISFAFKSTSKSTTKPAS
jgi:NAD(P)H-nitrite reductase large subunit